MKAITNLMIALTMIIMGSAATVAQTDEEIQFEPIHRTILPGDGYFRFDDVHTKNASVFLVGDELKFQSKKGEVASLSFALPVNPLQDYTLELTFNGKLGKGTILSIATNDYSLSLSSNFYNAFLGSQNYASDKKWKFPKGLVKDEIVCKIERRKRNVTFFVNNTYVCEMPVKNVSDPKSLIFAVILSSLKGEMLLNSIRVDQGIESED